MEQPQSTLLPNPKNEQAWLWQLAKEVQRLAEANESLDFAVAHSPDYLNGDMQVSAARGRLYKRVSDVLEWYKAGSGLNHLPADS